MSSSPSDGGPLAQRGPWVVTDAVELTVPELGPSAVCATLVAWLKQVGERVAADEPMCRLAIDELQFEVCSTADGEVTHLYAVAGDSVQSGSSLAEVATPAPETSTGPFYESASPSARAEPPPDPVAELDSEPVPVIDLVPDPETLAEFAPHPEPRVGDADPEPEPQSAVEIASEPEREPAVLAPVAGAWPPAGAGIDWARWHSPVVRKLAEQHGIDLSEVVGTGTGGRIRKRDVLELI